MTIDDFITYLTSAAIAVVLILVGGNATLAAELRSSVTVDGDVVTLGDLFDDAGDHAAVVVAQAPAPGTRSRIALIDLVPPTRSAGIPWQAPKGATHVNVLRTGLPVPSEDLRRIIAAKIKLEGYASSFEITLIGQMRPLQIPVDAGPGDIGVAISSYNVRTGSFVAALSVPTGAALNRRVELRGKVNEIGFVPGLNRQISPGETISERDISWVRLPKRQLNKNIIQSKQALVGMTPRRTLAVNKPLRLGDVQRPMLVKKGSQVLVAYRAGNLTITSSARALESGARGEVIRILNTRSKQTLEGVVTGPDQVDLSTPGRFALLDR